jgi:hypothetical protein
MLRKGGGGKEKCSPSPGISWAACSKAVNFWGIILYQWIWPWGPLLPSIPHSYMGSLFLPSLFISSLFPPCLFISSLFLPSLFLPHPFYPFSFYPLFIFLYFFSLNPLFYLTFLSQFLFSEAIQSPSNLFPILSALYSVQVCLNFKGINQRCTK